MNKQTTRQLCTALLFSLGMAVLGPYEIAGISAAVLIVLLAGVSMEPLYAVLSVAVYLVAGIWLPVYNGGHVGSAYLFGANGGFLLSLLLCALVLSALRKALRKNPFLALFVGLCASFLLYFGIGILWYVYQTGVSVATVFTSNLQTPCMLFGIDSVFTLLVAPRFRSLAK